MERESSSYPTASRVQFAALVRQAEEQWTLDWAALLIAQEEYPDLEPAKCLRQLDDLATAARALLPPAAGGRPRYADVIAALHEVLFEREGFRGNTSDYGDPRNSFLNQVLDRRLGLPITLTLLYIEVSRRLGMPAAGVGLPGHFLVGCPTDHAAGSLRYLDPFHRGRELTAAQCQALVVEQFGDTLPFHPTMLAPVTKPALLARLLRNLKHTYVQRGQLHRAVAAVERILLLEPSASEVRDRGVMLAGLGQARTAWFDLQAYLQAAPDAPDAVAVGDLAGRLWQQLGRTN